MYALVAGIGIFALNTAAIAFYWYASMFWFDMLMHTLGGVFVALLGGALFTRTFRTLGWREIMITNLLFIFIIGLGWEFYEYIVQFWIKGINLASISDSISDVICDMTGGILGTYFVILIKRRYNRE